MKSTPVTFTGSRQCFWRELYQQKYYQLVQKGTETAQNGRKKKGLIPQSFTPEVEAEKTTQLKYMLPLIQEEEGFNTRRTIHRVQPRDLRTEPRAIKNYSLDLRQSQGISNIFLSSFQNCYKLVTLCDFHCSMPFWTRMSIPVMLCMSHNYVCVYCGQIICLFSLTCLMTESNWEQGTVLKKLFLMCLIQPGSDLDNEILDFELML